MNNSNSIKAASGYLQGLVEESKKIKSNKYALEEKDHSKYTSYPKVKPLKNFKNLQETFNSSITFKTKGNDQWSTSDPKGSNDMGSTGFDTSLCATPSNNL